MKGKIACRVVFYALIVTAVGCIVAASCLLAHYPTVAYYLYGGGAALLLAQLFVAIGVTFCKPKRDLNGFEQWATCWIVCGVLLGFVALVPVELILLVVDGICETVRDRKPRSDEA